MEPERISFLAVLRGIDLRRPSRCGHVALWDVPGSGSGVISPSPFEVRDLEEILRDNVRATHMRDAVMLHDPEEPR